jgi:hypothetical protein
MGYKQTPLNVLKGQMTNKATGLMMKDSVAYMADSPLNEIDPKTGDRISREAKLKLEAMAESAKKTLAQRSIDEMKGGLYEDTTSTLPGLKPKQQAKSYGERQVEKAMATQTYKDTDKKISKADAQLLQVFDPVRPQYEAFEKQFGKGATPNKPFIAEDYAKGVSAKDVKLRKEMNYAATQPMTIQKKGLAKPTAKEIGGYQTRQTLEKALPTFEKGQKGTFVKGASEVVVQRNERDLDARQFRSFTRGTSGELSKATKQRVRKTGKYFSGPQTLTDIAKKHSKADFVKKGTNPYLPLN